MAVTVDYANWLHVRCLLLLHLTFIIALVHVVRERVVILIQFPDYLFWYAFAGFCLGICSRRSYNI